jgi:iron(III) transport system permease protein
MNWLRKNSFSIISWILAVLFLGPFLLYPMYRVLGGALIENNVFHPTLLLLPWQDFTQRNSFRNAFMVAVLATLFASVLALPPAFIMARLRFRGKNVLTALLLIPLLLPPFVGAIGLRQMLAREGVVNLLLMRWGVLHAPVDFLQMQLPMVVLVMGLELFPLIYLNVAAAWANVDTSLEEAAENLGAGGWRIFRSVTLPLLWPGYVAGALIVFIFAFTDLGTPLIFNYRSITAVQIFNASSDVSNPMGFVLAFWLTILAALVFWLSRRTLSGAAAGRLATVSRGSRRIRETNARPWQLPVIYGVLGLIIFLSMLPHIGVILGSFAHDWTNSLWPQWTLENYGSLIHDPSGLAASSIKVSLICALASMVVDVIGGAALAYAIVRGKVWAAGLLDTLAMIPLALPGLILAFGLLVGFSGTWLDPLFNPLPVLIISYAVRRLPYSVRSVSAGLQQTSVMLEEASLNMGAGPLRTIWQVTRPLVSANLMAAGLLTFAFAVLEVSDSLILAVRSDVMPIAKAIYQLSGSVSGGGFLACALGVVGMALLGGTFFLANRLLGKQMGSLFRL